MECIYTVMFSQKSEGAVLIQWIETSFENRFLSNVTSSKGAISIQIYQRLIRTH